LKVAVAFSSITLSGSSEALAPFELEPAPFELELEAFVEPDAFELTPGGFVDPVFGLEPVFETEEELPAGLRLDCARAAPGKAQTSASSAPQRQHEPRAQHRGLLAARVTAERGNSARFTAAVRARAPRFRTETKELFRAARARPR
jgi:hypothetical protein